MPPDAVAHSPSAPGFRLREFWGAADFPQMAAVLTASEHADQNERHVTADDLAATYQGLTNCDPTRASG